MAAKKSEHTHPRTDVAPCPHCNKPTTVTSTKGRLRYRKCLGWKDLVKGCGYSYSEDAYLEHQSNHWKLWIEHFLKTGFSLDHSELPNKSDKPLYTCTVPDNLLSQDW